MNSEDRNVCLGREVKIRGGFMQQNLKQQKRTIVIVIMESNLRFRLNLATY